jgi:hypothetical protein
MEGGVRLNHVVDQPAVARAQRAAKGGDNAGCHSRFEAQRIADCDHELATFEAFGVAERRRRERHCLIDANEREVGIRVVANQTSV